MTEPYKALIFGSTLLLWMTALALLILKLIERRGRFTVFMLLALTAIVALGFGWLALIDSLGLPLKR